MRINTSATPFSFSQLKVQKIMRNFGRHSIVFTNNDLFIGFDEYKKITNIAHWLYLIWSIGFIILGTIGNIFSIIIFIRWTNRLSVYIYFTYLCIINILIINIDIPYHYVLPYITDGDFLLRYCLPFTCKFIVFLTFFLRYLFVWLIVMINIDRCLYFTDNILRATLCHRRSANIICLLAIIFSFLANVHFLIFLKDPTNIEISSKRKCMLDGSFYYCESKNIYYELFYKKIWPIYNLTIFAIIPVCIMLICFAFIVRGIYLSRRRVADFDKRRLSMISVSSQNDRLRSISKVLICLDLMLPATIFPVLFFQIYLNYNPPEKCLNIGIFNLILCIGYSISFIKNTFAFLIFYRTGGKFRRAFSYLISRKNSFNMRSTR